MSDSPAWMKAHPKTCIVCGCDLDEAGLCDSCREFHTRPINDENEETISSYLGKRSGKKATKRDTPPSPATLPNELEGTMVGPYKILSCLGEGGMGKVYAAEQRSPVRRRVAVKLIKPGMDSREVLARFDAERQALAIMDHPNIARVLDGGVLENGRPYFVMDLVQGYPITEYCDRNQLNVNDRLELFLQVCLGIQHAHQKGVIHRDIKPSNVVVALNHGQPIPKVIDFGIAKAMGGELTQKTYYTLSGQIVGTPQYMSPEQAEAQPTDVDTRSDIYSLGILLYELLTGRTPITKEQITGSGLEEMLRLIREHEPPRPSALLEKLDAETISLLTANRSIDGGKLSQILRGDLDWLVMKAVEKDRNRRYETANSLASDIRCYLRNEPITATPPTIGYRLGKFARRHRGPIAAVGTVVVALVTGLVVSLWQASRANAEALRAKAAEGVALVNLGLAEEQRQLAESQRKVAEEERGRAEEQGRIALSEKENARKSQEFAELSRQKAEAALRDAEGARRTAETALLDLRNSLQREAEGEIRRSDLERRVTELLAFLRSEEIRQAFQRRHPDGPGIVRSIDETISRVFPGMRKGGGFSVEDFHLSLKLGQEGILLLDASLPGASRNLETALSLVPDLPASSKPPSPAEIGRIHVLLSQIDRMCGDYAATETRLGEADAAIAGSAPRIDSALLHAAILLERASIAAHLRRPESSDLLDIARKAVSGLPDDAPETLELRMRSASLALQPGMDSMIDADLDAEVAGLLGQPPIGNESLASLALPRAELRLANALKKLVGARPSETALSPTDGQRLTSESQIPEPILTEFRVALETIRALAGSSGDRRVKLSEMWRELDAAEALVGAGLSYEALQHFQESISLAAELRRLDRDLGEPLEVQFEASLALGAVYREAGQHTQHLASLELAHDALCEARSRQLDTTRYLAHDPDYFTRLTRAVIHQFFVASGYASTLEENAFYAEEVDFFNKPGTARRAILRSQEDFRRRYGNRLFQVQEIGEIQGGETEGLSCSVIVNAFLAAPGGANTIDFNRPDDRMFLEMSFAFDASNRLKIVRILRADRKG